MRSIYKLFFFLSRWKIKGGVPENISSYIIVVAPHSSNWDFMIGLCVRSILRFRSNFLAKKELFKAPFGFLFRRLGGYPVDRSVQANMVDQVTAIFKQEKNFVLAITPEGTRKNTGKWKTGFYHIAHKAGIPLVMASLDYSSRTVEFSSPLYTSGNLEDDARIMDAFFKGKKGKSRYAVPVLGD